MSLVINPIPIYGPWTQGWALDVHSISSDYLGDDCFGNPQFHTKRSELGELLYQFKYRQNARHLPVIVETAVSFLRRENIPVEIVTPVPPSNEDRVVQPILKIAEAVARALSAPYCQDGLVKVRSTRELKDVFDWQERQRLLAGIYHVSPERFANKRVLLLDDLYRSGATLATATTEILQRGQARSVIAIALTKTRNRR